MRLLYNWYHMMLLPSRRTFCARHTTMHQFTASLHAKPHSRVLVCLTVTFQQHFWQNDLDCLRACYCGNTGWNGYRNKSQQRKLTPERKILPPLLPNSNPRPFDHESGAQTTELSALPYCHTARPNLLELEPAAF